LIDFHTLEKFDKNEIFKVYNKWPQIAKESFEMKFEKIKFDGINHIVFVGMGGSGSIGDIFSAILSKKNIHVSIVKGYELPETVDSETLVVTTSISGNTVETFTVLKSANRKRCKIIAFSSGGSIKKFCIEKKIKHYTIPSNHSPRASVTSFLYSMLNILSPILPITKKEVMESIMYLEKIKKQISTENLSKKNPALSLAEWITSITMIYYPAGLQSTAIRFKNSLQENSKTHAMIEDVVEACHNNIVSWEKPSNVQPIMITGEDDHIKTKERWKILMIYFKKNRIVYKEIKSVKGNILSKIICLIYLLDFASIYLAVKNKTDPTPIQSVEFVKDQLAKRK